METTTNLKRTPLYNSHLELGGKIVPFAGWEMPVQYSGVVNEHNTTRNAAGLFDVSHMGEIFVEGPQAENCLQYLTPNNVAKLQDFQAHYSALTNEQGGLVDDIIIYKFNKEKYLVCVNASNADKDFDWMLKNNKFNAQITNRSSEYGQIAVQGPQAVLIVQQMLKDQTVADIKYFSFRVTRFFDCELILARTGYTGEDGFELFVPSNQTKKFWEALLVSGKDYGLIPAGLGARDSLRLEACMPLYGHELEADITAIESGLGWVVKPEKGEFVGSKIILKQKEQGAPRSLVGFFIDDAGIARQGDKILNLDGQEIGWVTSGTKTPYINKALGMAIIDSKFKAEGTKLFVQVRGKNLACHTVKKPFYKRS